LPAEVFDQFTVSVTGSIRTLPKETAMSPALDPIDSYFAADRRHDVDAVVSLFAPAGVVVDDRTTHRGTNAIRSWRDGAASLYDYTTTVIDRVPADDSAVAVTARLTGNFPGGTVDLTYEFRVVDDQIIRLTIAPPAPPEIPIDKAVRGRPGDAEYLAATKAFNLSARVTPEQAVVARTSADVIDAVNHARRAGMPIRVASTGHGATAAAPFDGALLVRLELSGGVCVDASSRTATVPAGSTWGEVVEAASKHGLAALHGSSASVGVIGYLLRGGVSFYGREFGLAANSLRSISIVLADGTETVASDDHEPELFWALRGGGGGFGVVTQVEIELYPMSAILTGATIWDATHADSIVPLWAQWTRDAPGRMSTSLRLMNLPPAPGIPPVLTNGQILVIDGAVTARGDDDLISAESVAADLFGPLLAVAKPVMNTWHPGPASELLHTHMDPPEPLPYAGHHILLGDLPEDGIERFLEAAGPGLGPPLMIAELRQLGGAFAAPSRPGGVLDRTAAHFAHVAIGVVPPSLTAASVIHDLRRVADALAPWNTGLTLPSVVEAHGAAQRTFADSVTARVAEVRRRFDPDGLFAGDVDPILDDERSVG
jgi:hypothetical protein